MQRNIPNEKIQFIKKRSEKSRKIDKILLLIPVVIILIGMIIAIFDIERRENPAERNYIYFKKDKKENVIDSLKRLNKLLCKLKLPKQENVSFTTFTYYKNKFFINEKEVGNLSFSSFKSNKVMSEICNENIRKLVNLFKYLYSMDVHPFQFYPESEKLVSNYKPYEKKYDDYTYDDDLSRFLETSKNKLEYDEFFKVLDSFDNVYLVAFRSAEIWEDDVPY